MSKNTLERISNQIAAAFLAVGYEVEVNITNKNADDLFLFSERLCQLSLDCDPAYPELSDKLFSLSMELDDYSITMAV